MSSAILLLPMMSFSSCSFSLSSILCLNTHSLQISERAEKNDTPNFPEQSLHFFKAMTGNPGHWMNVLRRGQGRVARCRGLKSGRKPGQFPGELKNFGREGYQQLFKYTPHAKQK